MPGLTFELTADEITPALLRLGDPVLVTQGLMAAGTALLSLTQSAFDEPSLRPTPWAARKSGGAHPLLQLSGTLRKSWHVRQQGADAVLIGNPTPYAAHQQQGSDKTTGRGSGVPPRPMFPADKSGVLTKAGEEAVGEALQAVVDAAAG